MKKDNSFLLYGCLTPKETHVVAFARSCSRLHRVDGLDVHNLPQWANGRPGLGEHGCAFERADEQRTGRMQWTRVPVEPRGNV